MNSLSSRRAPVIEVSDTTEAFCFTLCAEGAAGIVKPFKTGVFLGLDCYLYFKIKVARWRAFNDEVLISDLVLA